MNENNGIDRWSNHTITPRGRVPWTKEETENEVSANVLLCLCLSLKFEQTQAVLCLYHDIDICACSHPQIHMDTWTHTHTHTRAHAQWSTDETGLLHLLYFSLRCACCSLLKVSPVSLVVLAIDLAPFFIVTHTHTHTHTHTNTRIGVGVFRNAYLCFTMELVGECLRCLFEKSYADTRHACSRSKIGSMVGVYPNGTGLNPVEGNGHFFCSCHQLYLSSFSDTHTHTHTHTHTPHTHTQ